MWVLIFILLLDVQCRGATLTVNNSFSGSYLLSTASSSWIPSTLPSDGDDLIIDLSYACADPLKQDAFVFPFGMSTQNFQQVSIVSSKAACRTIVFVVGTLNCDRLSVGSDATIVLGSPLAGAGHVVGQVSTKAISLARGSLLQGNGKVTVTGTVDMSGQVVPGRRLHYGCPGCFPLFEPPNRVGTLVIANNVPATPTGTFGTYFESATSADRIQFEGTLDLSGAVDFQLLVPLDFVVTHPFPAPPWPLVQAETFIDTPMVWSVKNGCCGFLWEMQSACNTSCAPGCSSPIDLGCSQLDTLMPPGTLLGGTISGPPPATSVNCINGVIQSNDLLGPVCICNSVNGYTWSDVTCSTPVCPGSCTALCEAASPVPVCNLAKPPFSCLATPCVNGGTCNQGGTQCVCQAEWAGQRCEVPIRISSGLSAGVMAGIIVGGVVGCMIVFVVILLAVRAYQRNNVARQVKAGYMNDMKIGTPYRAF